ncbi:hypothetical protein OPQ81_002514 [Rhizoctonia solani]|nr:hypothetical protein OPQ81_002514 [Rhizoctonia solani]
MALWLGGHVGAAAVLYREGREPVLARKYVGTDKEHEVYEGEIVGLLLGLELLAREKEVLRAVTFIDNQAVLQTLLAGRTKKLGHLYGQLDGAIHAARVSNPGIRLDTRWIPGYAGVEGNEKADEAAKQAAEGGQDTNALLPHSLYGRVPINPTTAKRTRKARMVGEWRDWTRQVGKRERTTAMESLDSLYPSMNFKKQADTTQRQDTYIDSNSPKRQDAHIVNSKQRRSRTF